MKVVLDTNVLIAALIARGACADLLEHCVVHHTIVSSNAILSELRRHLTGRLKFTALEADGAVSLLESQMEVVMPMELEQSVCRDRDDDVVLGTARAASADCIVTGDRDLLVIRQYEGVEIVAPSDFAGFEEEKGKR